mmetsp:Transcript_93452/g.267410  ORF Transcript_93452/g.267410 Transcript_93452/m.267410 type:complete len:252 (-) Transcript_93452:79-834(-)
MLWMSSRALGPRFCSMPQMNFLYMSIAFSRFLTSIDGWSSTTGSTAVTGSPGRSLAVYAMSPALVFAMLTTPAVTHSAIFRRTSATGREIRLASCMSVRVTGVPDIACSAAAATSVCSLSSSKKRMRFACIGETLKVRVMVPFPSLSGNSRSRSTVPIVGFHDRLRGVLRTEYVSLKRPRCFWGHGCSSMESSTSEGQKCSDTIVAVTTSGAAAPPSFALPLASPLAPASPPPPSPMLPAPEGRAVSPPPP